MAAYIVAEGGVEELVGQYEFPLLHPQTAARVAVELPEPVRAAWTASRRDWARASGKGGLRWNSGGGVPIWQLPRKPAAARSQAACQAGSSIRSRRKWSIPRWSRQWAST